MNEFRRIPSVDTIINSSQAQPLLEQFGRNQVLNAIRTHLDSVRNQDEIKADQITPAAILAACNLQLEKIFTPTLVPVINASGVILHTNLGRAPLSDDTLQAMQIAGTNYNTLEYDLHQGKRGSRSVHVEDVLRELTGAEAATVVNNNASAVLIALSALANRRRVIISRTQLIEIGGGFRIPDVMKQSGAKLNEIGTTNRVHLADYRDALEQPAALVMRAHHSNFRIVGFTTEPELGEICESSHSFAVPVYDDLGSGTFLDTSIFGLEHEPTVAESLAAGADLVSFSGDKLLGGPQAGILIGKKKLIEKIKKHPLMRAIRPDKICLAGLTATLYHYLRGEAQQKIPIWQMISMTPEQIQKRAHLWQISIKTGTVVASRSTIGGGSLPGETLPTFVLAIKVDNPNKFTAKLRQLPVPIIARVENDLIMLDPRTVFENRDNLLLKGVTDILAQTENKFPQESK